MSNKKYILTEKKDNICTIKMNKPKTLNSLHPILMDELVDALLMADKDPDVKAVVLTGEGKAFCAGGDLEHIESLNNPVESHKYIEQAGKVVKTIIELNKPVIAMVNGVAAGAGFNIVLACDIIFSGESARFGQSFSKIGLVPDGGGTYLLPRIVGLYKAKELMFTAELISAYDAKQYGFVNHVVEDEKLNFETYKFAKKLASSAPVAIKFIKKILNQSYELDLDSTLELEASIQTLCIQTQDNKEGIAAFKEKRDPQFLGK